MARVKQDESEFRVALSQIFSQAEMQYELLRDEKEDFDQQQNNDNVLASKFMYDDLEEKKSFTNRQRSESIGNMGL